MDSGGRNPFSTFWFRTVPTLLSRLCPFSSFLLVAVALLNVERVEDCLKRDFCQAAFGREEGFSVHGSCNERYEACLAIAMFAAQEG